MEGSSDEEFLPGCNTIDDFIKMGYKTVLEMTKVSNTLPSEEHFHYYSSYPAFEEAMTKQGNQALKCISSVIQSSGVKGNIIRRDLEEKFELLLDTNDTILEQVALNLDEVAGIRKNPAVETSEAKKNIIVARPLSGSWNQSYLPPQHSISPQAARSLVGSPIFARPNLPKVFTKPQLNFLDKFDNSPGPFEPKLKEKPNALKPLSILLYQTDFGECFNHPYEYELDLFNPPEDQLKEVEPKLPRSADTPVQFVENVQQLQNMLQHLKNYKELAIDLEHHSYRSFQGFTCLMQISSRHTDFIVDTLELRGELHCLNEIFTDPKVVKVLHGADGDVQWLQKDFGLYLVNMFDTHQASKLLNLPRLSLAFLAKHYCDYDMDKKYQLADWRLRPLPKEMIEYARMDTHLLLYIYDRLKNDLWQTGLNSDRLIKAAIHQSTQLCKKIYVKPQLTEEAHLVLYQKSRKMFNNRQMYALKEVFAWRFQTAAREDESVQFVLPNHMLLQIAETLPREIQGILACCNPIPPLVRQNLNTIHRLILEAREKPLIQTAATEEISVRPLQTEWTKVNIESTLHCPHQLLKDEQRDNLPTLLGDDKPKPVPQNGDILKNTARIGVFSAFNRPAPVSIKKVLSPYQRYLMAKPYLQHLAELAAEKEAQKPAPAPLVPLQGLKVVQKHFEQLDSRTAAQNEPIKRPRSESEEIEGELEPTKKTRTEAGAEEAGEPQPADNGEIKFSNSRREKIKDFRPGRKNFTVNDIQSKFQRNKKKSMLKKRQGLSNQQGTWSNGGPPQEGQNQPSTSSQPFDYNQVDFNKFQGGSKAANKKNMRDKGGRGKGKQKKRSNFPQRQNQKSHTYKS
ncbi:Hypothetical predicted protein [Cloeon dipterum]|uniref:Exosome complex component 10 homolog n=1 Tax=Cloeon dipterum TaxID=197152 RepID=A0A8S1E020_9INSE|nr:Hypothetical predicted protein [Cloeon dipterum]